MSNQLKDQPNVVRLPDIKAIEIAAAQWLTRFDSEQMSDSEYDHFQEWLDQDERHLKAFREASEFWSETNTMSQFFKDEYRLPKIKKTGISPTRPAWLTVAALMVMAIFVTLWSSGYMQPAANKIVGEKLQYYETAIGDYKEIKLDDGSTVKLNTNSLVEVTYTPQERIIHLHRGEAYFEVEKAPDRPFYVRAGNKVIQAVGTAFKVYVKNSGSVELDYVEVLVTEGVVKIAPDVVPLQETTAPSKQRHEVQEQVIVSAGQQIEFGATMSEVEVATPDEIKQIDDWRTGMLLFRGESLEYVLDELSRYSTTRFVFADDDLRTIQVGGYFNAKDIDALLLSLEHNFSINATRTSKDVVLLARLD